MRGIVKGGLLSWLILIVVLAGCSSKTAKGKVEGAISVMNPTEGSKVQGVVIFKKEGKGIRVTGSIEGLSPGPHAFYIHEFGNCTAPDASSAGGRLNIAGMLRHGPKSKKLIIGDLGNIVADKNGLAKFEKTDNLISLEGPGSIIGRSLVVSARGDDFKAQPTGASGARVACGVIGIAK